MGTFVIEGVKKLADGTVYHLGSISEGAIAVGELLKMNVDVSANKAVARNHTATHLLHAALKKIAGEHANQAGSLVNAERLRFDFTHFEQLKPEELKLIEILVNEQILAGNQVSISQRTMDEARALGAMALFGEKYGDQVRLVEIGDISRELCGGTHVNITSDIGLFKIISEESVAAGVRRIEAVTGMNALAYVQGTAELLSRAAQQLRCAPADVLLKLDGLQAKTKELENDIDRLNGELAKSKVEILFSDAYLRELNGLAILVAKTVAPDIDNLRKMADILRDRIVDGAIVLAAAIDGKANFIAVVAGKAKNSGLHAGKIVKLAAKIAGGGGGGKPDIAQAGGGKPDLIDDALESAFEMIEAQINGG
jgi:alanyl-tRNA synthetase